MTKLTYFQSCHTKQDAKKLFRELAKKYHPDTNPNDDTNAIMAAIIAEYEAIIKKLPTEASDTSTTDNMTEDEYNTHVSAELQAAIDNIAHLPITIEIIGQWVWVSGNTYPYKAYLTANNFTWCPKKRMYSWHMGPRHKRYGKAKDIDDIRATYGSQQVKNKYKTAIG